MKYTIKATNKFQKDLKRIQKRGSDISQLVKVIDSLAAGKSLPHKNKDHSLGGKYTGCHECHITPDLLLVYERVSDSMILYLIRTGSHSDLF